jgi:hypothetical protein
MDVGCDFIKNNEDVVTDEDAFCSSPFYNSLYSSPKHDPKYLEDLEWFLKEVTHFYFQIFDLFTSICENQKPKDGITV